MDKLAKRFRWWGELANDLGSPLYTHLANAVADDPKLLALSAQKLDSQPPENMLLGAVHFLLQHNVEAELRNYYLSLVESPLPAEQAFPAFRAFCLDNYEAIVPILKSRMTQTNVVRRCTFLMPAFQHVVRLLDNRPIAQIEVGCSAGLNLRWDRFGYRHGEQVSGTIDSAVNLSTELRGEGLPPLGEMPTVFGRIGIDLNPLDVTNPDDVAWLDALIWPEHTSRRALLRNAIAVAQQYPVELVQGDAIAQIGKVAERFPSDIPLVVYHSFVMYQVSAEKTAAVPNQPRPNCTHTPALLY